MNRRKFLAMGVGVGAAATAPLSGAEQASIEKKNPLESFAKPREVDPAVFAEAAYRHFIPGKKTCGESIVMAACDLFGVDSHLISNAALGLAGGVGLQGKTCGCVTGAAMVLSLVASSKEPEDPARFKRAQKAVGEYVKRFEGQYSTSMCRDLSGLDLTTSAGLDALRTRVKAETCSEVVRAAARMLAESLPSA